MKVLLVGGSGHVGSFITPYLREKHDLRVLDVRRPAADVEFVEGSVTDPDAIRRAVDGVDAFVWLVMRKPQGGTVRDQDIETIVENYDMNAKGLHLFLYLAQEAGLRRGVYTSSMSVHYRKRESYPSEEAIPLDTPSVYGLSKGIGEGICQYFCRWWDMNVIALRITGPRTRAQYLAERRNPPRDRADGSPPLFVTDEEDLATAYLAALDAAMVGHNRFDAFFIAGDEHEKEHNLSKARRVLGWEPRSHRLL
ncbi:MAG: NAD(P)-dependent oxidoreductase [Chloroflexota bacterium]|nr:MAG: NAD(P)-dependent oxidoreductase [Chloroflexota bacterium]